MELVAAIRAFRTRRARAKNRQEDIQLYCVDELARRGIPGAEIEIKLPGAYRSKDWDVGLMVDGEPRLAISCKSIVSNHGGTVPNRVDDMLGEAVDLHRAHPKAVLGYLFMMSRVDESKKEKEKTEKVGGMTDSRLQHMQEQGDIWFDRLVESVSMAGNRSGTGDFPEKFEAISCSQIDFLQDPYEIKVHETSLSTKAFFDQLTTIYRARFG